MTVREGQRKSWREKRAGGGWRRDGREGTER